jgi:uncharacterized protein (DUF983 family)
MSLYLFVKGRSWVVERRRETTPASPGSNSAPKLFLYFSAPDGETRRSDIADDFPEEPTARLLESVWRYAEVTRVGDLGEMTSRGEIVMPRMRDVARYFWRALLLRCPNCGGHKVLRSWFKLLYRCDKCGIRLDRGESEDYFLGGMFFNIVLAEVLFALVLLVVVVVMWPNVPWAGIQYSLIVAMIAAPIVLYPVSRLMWLALDLLLRPPDAAEMAWHASGEDDEGSHRTP